MSKMSLTRGADKKAPFLFNFEGEVLEMVLEKFQEILVANDYDEDVKDILQSTVSDFTEYVDICSRETEFVASRAALIGDDPEKFRQAVTNFDKLRRATHDACISKVKIINRLCSASKIEPLYPCSASDLHTPENRAKVGDFIAEAVQDIHNSKKLEKVFEGKEKGGERGREMER